MLPWNLCINFLWDYALAIQPLLDERIKNNELLFWENLPKSKNTELGYYWQDCATIVITADCWVEDYYIITFWNNVSFA